MTQLLKLQWMLSWENLISETLIHSDNDFVAKVLFIMNMQLWQILVYGAQDEKKSQEAVRAYLLCTKACGDVLESLQRGELSQTEVTH